MDPGVRGALTPGRKPTLRVTGHAVEVFGDTAVVDYTFVVDYELASQRHREQGREVLVLRRTPQGWRAVWRTQSRTG